MRKRDRGRTTAATDIDDAFAGLRFGAVDQDVGDRLKHRVLGRLPVSPALAARPVPMRMLARSDDIATGVVRAVTY